MSGGYSTLEVAGAIAAAVLFVALMFVVDEVWSDA